MLSGWNKFRGWSALEFFLRNPTTEIHVTELARVLDASPSTANTYLKNYLRDGVLSEARKGNALFYRLVDSEFTKALKKCFVLSELNSKKFVERVLEENRFATSIVLYGTRASGDFDEKSDFDFLVFSKDKTFPKKAVSSLSDYSVNLRVLTISEWRGLNRAFKQSIQKNHVVLYGAGLVVE